MTDLELIDKYCETSLIFVHPLMLNDIMSRGLYQYINLLPKNEHEAKAVVRARLAKDGKYFGDPEIDHVADQIRRLEFLKERLNRENIADAHKIKPILDEMQDLTTFLLNYYK